MPHFGEVRVDARAPDLPPRVAVPEVQGEVACQGREEEWNTRTKLVLKM